MFYYGIFSPLCPFPRIIIRFSFNVFWSFFKMDDKTMRLIAYANKSEVEHIKDELEHTWWIGFKGENITPPQIPFIIGDTTEIILFGSCGLLQRKDQGMCYMCLDYYNGLTDDICRRCEFRIRNDMLLSPRSWYKDEYFNGQILGIRLGTDPLVKGLAWWGTGVTVDESCRDRKKLLEQHPEAIVVDQESYILGEWCATRGIKFQSVRYITDKCKRIYPRGINYFWKRRQHKKMQRRFLEVIQAG